MYHYHRIPVNAVRLCEKNCYVHPSGNIGLDWNDIDVKRDDLEKLFFEKFKELDRLGVPYSECIRSLVGVVLNYGWSKTLAQKE